MLGQQMLVLCPVRTLTIELQRVLVQYRKKILRGRKSPKSQTVTRFLLDLRHRALLLMARKGMAATPMSVVMAMTNMTIATQAVAAMDTRKNRRPMVREKTKTEDDSFCD